MHNVPVITLDGYSGAGKGSVGRMLADTLNWHFLDSGQFYRALAFLVHKQQIPLNDVQLIQNIAHDFSLCLVNTAAGKQVLVNNEDVTAVIGAESVGALASQLAALPEVRSALLIRQRDCCRPPGLIADGRDMGTVVFPDAPLKVFLTADLTERARRRMQQLHSSDSSVTLEQMVAVLRERDTRDQQRELAPLRPALNAVTVDTTDLSLHEVVRLVLDCWYRRVTYPQV